MSEPLEETLARLKASVMANPNNPVTRLMIGRTYQQLGKLDEAKASVKRATTLKPDYFEALVLLGGLCRTAGEARDAADAFARAVRVKPTAIDVWVELARALLNAGDDAGAVEAYAKVLAERADDAEALRDGGLASFRCEQFERAVLWLERVVEPDAKIHLALARSALRVGKSGRAVASFHEAISLGAESADVCREQARALVMETDLQAAIGAYAASARLDPRSIDTLREKGALERQLGHHEQAAATFRAWTEQHPDDAEAFHALARAQLVLGLASDAVDASARAARLAPDEEVYALTWGRALHAAERLREAAEVLERVAYKALAAAATHCELADVYRKLVRLDDSRRVLEAAEARWPAELIVYRTQVVHMLADGDVTGATAQLAKAWALAPSDGDVRAQLAELLLRQGLHGEALAHFDTLRKEQPERAALQAGAGACYAALKRPIEALEAYEIACAAAPRPEWSLGLGRVYLVLGRVAEAERVLTLAATSEDPGAARDAQIELGAALRVLGREQEARDAFSLADKARPGDLHVTTALAELELRLGRPRESLVVAEEALRSAPDDGGLHRARAGALSALGRMPEALDALEQALWQTPDDAALHGALGKTYFEMGRHDAALRHLERATSLLTGDVELMRVRAKALDAQGRKDEALVAFREVSAVEGSEADWLRIAQLEESAGQNVEAAVAYREATRLAPDHPAGYRGAGRLYRILGQVEEAARALRHAVRIDARDVESWMELGRALRLGARPDNALDAFARAIEVAPGEAGPHRELGEALSALHEPQRAAESLERAIALDPSDVVAQRLLAGVRRALGEHAASAVALEAAYQHGDRAVALLEQLAEARYAAGDRGGAIAVLREAAAHVGVAAQSVARLGVWLTSEGLFEEALLRLDAAVAEGHDAAETHVALAESALALDEKERAWTATRRAIALAATSVPAQRMRARLAQLDERWQEAAEALEKVLLSEPESVEAQRDLGLAYSRLGLHSQAVRPLEAAARAMPGDAMTLVALGRARLANRQPREAADVLRRALMELDATRGPAHIFATATGDLAEALLALSSPAKAVAVLERGLERVPQSAPLLALVGRANAAAGDYARAVGAFRQALAAAPDDAATMAALGAALAASGNDEEAIASFAKARSRGFVDAASSYAYGLCLHRQKRYGEAGEAYASARSLGMGGAELLIALGHVRAAVGRDEAAAEAYEAAVMAQPNEADARFALALTQIRLGRHEAAMEHYRALRGAHPSRAEHLLRVLHSGSA